MVECSGVGLGLTLVVFVPADRCCGSGARIGDNTSSHIIDVLISWLSECGSLGLHCGVAELGEVFVTIIEFQTPACMT